MDIQKSMEGFSSHIKREYGEVVKFNNHTPIDSRHAELFKAWQATKASVTEGFVLVKLNDLTTVLSNCSDAMMDEETSSVYDETGEPSTWFDHHVVAEGNLLLAIGKAREPSND